MLAHLLICVYFSISSLLVLFLFHVPFLNQFLDYGKTLSNPGVLHTKKTNFYMFYIAGITSSNLFLVQYISKTSNLSLLSLQNQDINLEILLPLILTLIQSTRRLYECIYIQKSRPDSYMHITHFICGILFYIILPISLTIGNINTMIPIKPFPYKFNLIIGCILFIYASISQYKHHLQLSNIRSKSKSKIAIPKRFTVLFPHYRDEILIYCAVWIASLPNHGLLSWVFNSPFFILVWVIVDLSVSAAIQRRWYKKNLKTVGLNNFW